MNNDIFHKLYFLKSFLKRTEFCLFVKVLPFKTKRDEGTMIKQ